MPASTKSSDHRRALRRGAPLALAAALLAVFLAWWARDAHRAGDAAPAGAAASGAPAPVPATARRAGAATWEQRELGPAVDALPGVRCWGNLLALDRSASLADLHRAITAAGGGDALLQTYLQERLTELVGDDAGHALQVVDWALEAGMPTAQLYLDALKAAGAVRDPRVSARLLAIGEGQENPADLRSAALTALETQHRLAPAAEERVKAMALGGAADGVAWTATRTLGRVMAEDFARTGTYEPYLDDLLQIGRASGDDAVRLLALEMPTYSNPLIGGKTIDALADILKTETEKDVREMAVFRLGVTGDPDRALEALRAAFTAERDLCVRWAIFRFAVRAAGPRSLPVLAEFARQDPRFARDYQDFRAIYDAGEVDFERVWMQKPERQPCQVDQGSPEGG